MGSIEETAEALAKSIRKGQKMTVVKGLATKVDEEKAVFYLERDGQTDIKCNVNTHLVDSGYLLLIPKDKSTVVVGFIDGTEDNVLLQVSEVDKVKLKIGDQTLTMSGSGFVFNGGLLKGLVKIDAMVSKLNALENKVNSIRSAYNTHTHPVAGPLASATLGVVAGALTTTTVEDLENPKIKQ